MREIRHVEKLLKSSQQGQHANDVYFAQLIENQQKGKDYVPVFSHADGSKKASRIKGNKCDDTMFEMSVDVYGNDINLIQSPLVTPNDLQEHLSFMLADNRRKTEVSIRDLNPEERTLMEEAKDKDVDQLITHSVFKIVRRAGVPIKRIMAM